MEACVHEAFASHAARQPEATAAICAADRVSYGALHARAEAVACALRRLGVGPEVTVGIFLDPSIAMIVAILAVWKAGGAYVPLEPRHPVQRLDYVLRDAGVRAVLTDTPLAEVLSRHVTPDVALVRLDALQPDAGTPPLDTATPASPATSADSATFTNSANAATDRDTLAYVMYTSGSTGVPKGVMISHRALGNHMRWLQRLCPLGPDDRVIQKAPFSFDASVWEICAPLMVGGRLIISPPGTYRDPAALIETMAREGVTALKVTPSLLRELLEIEAITSCVTLRRVFCGAEAMPPELPHRFFERLDAAELYNLYGPTETAIDVTWWRCTRGDRRGPVPIGRAIDRTQISILDARLRPVPQGLAGELCIAGESLGRGYWRRPDLTAERFVPHPQPRTPGERLYRTGDQARWLGDGSVEYRGRLDRQIKLRGFRVELGEIEAVLLESIRVREAAVTAREHEAAGLRLVAHVVLADGMDLAAGDLKAHVASRLPDYMVPAAIIALAALPRLPNGKVDRAALAASGADGVGVEAPFVAPTTEIERRLADVWQEVLHTDRVGIHHDFFELGGDSIVSIQIVSRASQRGLKLRVRQIFEHPTIAALAPHVTLAETPIGGEMPKTPGAPKIAKAPETLETLETPDSTERAERDDVPLTPIQQRFFAQRLANPHHYNQAVLVELSGVTLADVEARVARWLTAHAALRQRWHERENGWTMTEVAADADTTRVVTCVDLSGVAPDAQTRELERQATQVQASLHLTAGPLLRVVLFRRSGGEDRLLVVIHHLAVDGVSWRILLEDWQQRGPAPGTARFADWARAVAAFARTPAAEADAAYWLAEAEAPVDAWPVDRPVGANTLGCAATVATTVGVAETQALLQQGSRAPLAATLLTACVYALRERIGVSCLRIDMEGHGREDAIVGLDVSRTVGWFTTIYPLVLTCPPGRDIEGVRQAVAAQLQQVPRHGFTFGLLRYLGARPDWRARLAAIPPAPVSFNYLGQFNEIGDAGFRLAPESTGSAQSSAAQRTHEIQITATIVDRSLQVRFAYSRERYHHDTIAGVASAFREALHRLAVLPVARVTAPAGPTPESETASASASETASASESTSKTASAAEAETETEARIVRVGGSGSGVPLFCVASYGDTPAFIFRDLARALRDQHPVYGLRADSEDGEFSYERCAARHVEAIRQIRPHGPYALAGYSLGGLVAFEAARQLQAAGEDVPELILFDTVCPNTQLDVQTIDDTELLCRILRTLDPELVLPNEIEIERLPESQRLASIYAHAIGRAVFASRADMGVSDVRAFLRLWRQRAAFVPRGFSGRVLLLRTHDTSILDAQLTLPWALGGDAPHSLGWRLIEPCALTVIRVPGDHANVLFRPHVATIAAQVTAWLAPPGVPVAALQEDSHDGIP